MQNKKGFKILKWLLNLALVVSLAVVFLMPVGMQDLTIVFDTQEEKVSFFVPESELENVTEFTIQCQQSELQHIREIRLYRGFKSFCVGKISVEELKGLASFEAEGLVFNESACKQLKAVSSSVLAERLMLAEVIFCVYLIIRILIIALREKAACNDLSNHGLVFTIKRFFSDTIKYGAYMKYAARASLKSDVSNSYLKRAWWILEPLLTMMVYVLIFGNALGRNIENYITFTFTALIMWGFMNRNTVFSVRCIRNKRDIVSRVYVPKHVLLITNMLINTYKMCFTMIILIPMLFIFRVNFGLGLLWIIPVFLLMFVLTFGVGMIFMHYGVYVDDLSQAVGIMMTLLMYMSGIFYDIPGILPAPLNSVMMVLNPVAMLIDTMRGALLYDNVANVPLIGIWMVLSVLLTYIGADTVYKHENTYVKVV